MVSLQKADERSLCPYTNLRLLYWPRINHCDQCGCASKTLTQKTIQSNIQMNCVPPSSSVKAKKRYACLCYNLYTRTSLLLFPQHLSSSFSYLFFIFLIKRTNRNSKMVVPSFSAVQDFWVCCCYCT